MGTDSDTRLAGWLPIESAPRDGTRILAAFDERKSNRVDVVVWEKNLGEKGYFKSFIVEFVSGVGHMKRNQPIAWMPLPPPPQVQHD